MPHRTTTKHKSAMLKRTVIKRTKDRESKLDFHFTNRHKTININLY